MRIPKAGGARVAKPDSRIHPLVARTLLRRTLLSLAGLALAAAIFVAGLYAGDRWGVPFETPADWEIALYEGDSPLTLHPAAGVDNPILTARDIRSFQAAFVADPFLARTDTAWYLFFEQMHRRSMQGDIGLAMSRDGRHWKYHGTVLRELTHLSYPYVFQDGSTWYMIPENRQSRSVRLYRAEHFPVEWRLLGVLLVGDYTDPSPFQYEGRWWMFAGSNPGVNDELHLFMADSLTGPWREHPRSPVVRRDAHRARPGGRIVTYDGKLIRFAQDDAPAYGYALRAFEIIRLTPTEYREREITMTPALRASGNGWNAIGMHQLDAMEVSPGHWRAVVDGHGLGQMLVSPR